MRQIGEVRRAERPERRRRDFDQRKLPARLETAGDLTRQPRMLPVRHRLKAVKRDDRVKSGVGQIRVERVGFDPLNRRPATAGDTPLGPPAHLVRKIHGHNPPAGPMRRAMAGHNSPMPDIKSQTTIPGRNSSRDKPLPPPPARKAERRDVVDDRIRRRHLVEQVPNEFALIDVARRRAVFDRRISEFPRRRATDMTIYSDGSQRLGASLVLTVIGLSKLTALPASFAG